jgi:hypothetical protein
MPAAVRTLGVIAVCGLALGLTSCSSNNEGKIAGKWKNSSAIGAVPAGLVTVEFASDNSFKMSGPDGTVVQSGKFKLGNGDYVNFTDLNPPQDGKTKARVKISITNDTMTWTEDKGTYQFTRLKGESAPAGGK